MIGLIILFSIGMFGAVLLYFCIHYLNYKDNQANKRKINPVNFQFKQPCIEDIQDNCTICIGSMKNDIKKTVKLKCDHTFHKRCVEPWLYLNNTCPICRQIIN